MRRFKRNGSTGFYCSRLKSSLVRFLAVTSKSEVERKRLALRKATGHIAIMFRLTARWLRLSRASFILRALWICASVGIPTLSAANGGDVSKLSYGVWQVEEGLEQNPITAVVQSRIGYIWAGTYTGLMRFDGVRVTAFDSASIPALQNGRITSLFEDATGVLWIGHESGDLSRLSNGEFQPAGRAPGWPGGAVEDIAADERGDLWALSDLGILIRMRDGHTVEPPGGASPSRPRRTAPCVPATTRRCP